jgi:subtilisin family serine protease
MRQPGRRTLNPAFVHTIFVLLSLLASYGISTTGGSVKHDVIFLRTAEVDTRTAASIAHVLTSGPRARRDQIVEPGRPGSVLQLLVRLRDEACTDEALQAKLASRGRVLYHMSPCTFSVLAGYKEALGLDGERGIAWVGPMLPRYKIAPELLEAGRCPLAVQLEAPLVNRTRQVMGSDSRLHGKEWAVHEAARWVRDLQLDGAEAQSATSVVVQCKDGDLERVALRVASEAHVHWVDRHMAIEKRNYHAAHNKMSGEMQVDVGAVWARGINGSGEVVHMADSGVDVGHCFFHDSKVDVPYNKVNQQHRKVVAYWMGNTGDMYDAIEGHGTHVAATIAGSLVDAGNSLRNYQGIAPGAKLAVTDGEIQSSVDGEGQIMFGDIEKDIYQKPLTEAGAQLQSYSWGTREYSYTAASATVDKFLHANREALFFWAAGNDGEDSSRPMQTIGSPASAKNCLTVGASLPGIDSVRKVRGEGHTRFTFNQAQLAQQSASFSNQHVAHYSGRGPCSDGRMKPEVVLPGLLQSAASNGRRPNANCCLNPECAVSTRCPADCHQQGACVEQPAGAGSFECRCRAGFCGRDCSVRSDAPTPGACCNDAALGSAGLQCVNSGRCEDSVEGSPSSHSYSRCVCSPAFGGLSCGSKRLASLATTPKMGTSMAAPVAAGMAALLREYLRKGFYPCGVDNPADAQQPSGALLKALIVASAAKPQDGKVVQLYYDKALQTSDTANAMKAQVTSSECGTLPAAFDRTHCEAINASMRTFPNNVQGFGRPLVDNILHFSAPAAAYPASSFRLFLSDDRQATTGSEHTFCLYTAPPATLNRRATSSTAARPTPLVATLTWMDPPSSPAAKRTLVNDLDLEVEDTCSLVHTGNAPLAVPPPPAPASTLNSQSPNSNRTGTTAPPASSVSSTPSVMDKDASGLLRDRGNNVERVVLQDAGLACAERRRRVYLRVRGHYVPQGPQPYALAVSSGLLSFCPFVPLSLAITVFPLSLCPFVPRYRRLPLSVCCSLRQPSRALSLTRVLPVRSPDNPLHRTATAALPPPATCRRRLAVRRDGGRAAAADVFGVRHSRYRPPD